MTKVYSIQLFIDLNHLVHLTSWDSDINDTLHYLSNNGPSLQLKELILSANSPLPSEHHTLQPFPVFHGVEKLEINSFPGNCDRFKDF